MEMDKNRKIWCIFDFEASHAFFTMVIPRNLLNFDKAKSFLCLSHTLPIGLAFPLRSVKFPLRKLIKESLTCLKYCEDRNEIFGVGFHLMNTLL